MNKTILGIAAIVVVLGAAIWYFMDQKENSSDNGQQASNESTGSEQNGQESNNNAAQQPGSSNTTLASLSQSGKAQKCTFSTQQDNVTVNGTSYLDGRGKYRVDFTSKDQSQTYTGHNIFDSNATIYMWMDGQPQGFKYDVQSYATAQQATSFDPNVQTQYDCESWNADASMFTPPSNITFTSFAELMGGQR